MCTIFVNTYVYVCVCVCECVSLCLQMCLFVKTHVYVLAFLHPHTQVFAQYMSMGVYVEHVYGCRYVCMCVDIYRR